MEIRVPQFSQQSSESALAKKQIVLGLAAIFAVYFCRTYFIQTFTIARPRMAAGPASPPEALPVRNPVARKRIRLSATAPGAQARLKAA